MTVAALQSKLKAAGFDPGPVDGALGGKTLQALASFIMGKAIPEGVGAALWPHFRDAGITTRLRILHFMAQVAHESGFKPVEEKLSYSAKRMTEVWPSRFPTVQAALPYSNNPEALANNVYGGRMGNHLPGDGYLFRGRGWAQHTGRDGYRAIGAEDWPDRLLTIPGAAEGAVRFWRWKNLSPHADADDIQAVTKRWNGGLVGLDDRKTKLARGKAVWPA